ncbi:MAG: tetratricopeptide repeat protein [Bacteroidota bacterium]
MAPKFILGTLCAASLTLFSCNRTEEKKADAPTEQSTMAPQAAQAPENKDLIMFEKKFEADSSNFELRAMLAANYYTAGQLQKAEYHFLKVYEHDNKNMVALANLGNIYYDSKQDDKAIGFYEKALELDPKNIDMRCDLATCYMNINKLKKSIKLLKENIAMNPKHEKSHHNLSVILKQNGDLKEADDEMKIYESLKTNKK